MRNSETITDPRWEISGEIHQFFFKENCKTYRNLTKPVTPVRLSFPVKFINNTFDKFNNIYILLFSVIGSSH